MRLLAVSPHTCTEDGAVAAREHPAAGSVRLRCGSINSAYSRRDHASGTEPGLHQWRQSRGSEAVGLPPLVSVALWLPEVRVEHRARDVPHG